MSTLTAADNFTRFMVRNFDERDFVSVPTGFQSLFGDPANGSVSHFSPDASTVEIDISRANEKTAALIPRGVGRPLGATQRNMIQEKFTSQARAFPLSREILDINSDDLTKRIAGETPYQGGAITRIDKMRMLATRGAREGIHRMVRLDERLAAQSIIEGVQDAILDTVDTALQYDFRRNASHQITPANTWNSGSQDILKDLDDACDVVRQNGHHRADTLILGSDAISDFLADSAIQTRADIRRFEVVSISLEGQLPARFQRMVNSGFELRGKIVTPKGRTLWLFTYDEFYQDAAGTSTPYMPTDKAVVMSVNARRDRYFGPPEFLPMTPQHAAFMQENFGFGPTDMPIPVNIKNAGTVVEAMSFWFDAYESNDRTKISLRIDHAPIFATTATDTIATLNDLHTP